MSRTGGGRPGAVGQRDNDHVGSGASAGSSTTDTVVGREREPLPTGVRDLPALPVTYAATIEAGLASLDLELPPGIRRAIDDHVRLLLAWTTTINLTAIRDPADVAREHVLDALSAVAIMRQRRVDAFLDLGSGGGFPGIPLALALPARRALLVDSIAKKARFLATATSATGLAERVAVAAARAEELARDRRHREAWPAVVARAVAPLAGLAELAFPLIRVGGWLVAWKRLPIADELADARSALAAVGGGPLVAVSSGVPGLGDHVLVVATKVRPTPARFPRTPAERRRSPR